MKYAWLPELLREVAEVAGLPAALDLAAARGGQRVIIPARALESSWLVEAVGREAADKICDHFRTLDPSSGREHGARKIVIPVGPAGPSGVMKAARRRLREKLEAGTSARQAAREVGLHERTAWKTKAKLAKGAAGDQLQPSLFDVFPAPTRTRRKG